MSDVSTSHSQAPVRSVQSAFYDNTRIIVGIYYIHNDITGTSYIGSSDDIERRWKNHIVALNGNRHHNLYLQRSWNKYGSGNFSFGIIEICEADDLLYLEQYHLDRCIRLFNIAQIAVRNKRK